MLFIFEIKELYVSVFFATMCFSFQWDLPFFAFKVLQRQDCSINSGNSRDPVVDRWCPGGGMSTQI